MELLAYTIFGLLMVVFGFLLWLMLKDAKPTHHHNGWGGGHGVNINHRLSKKDKEN